MRKMEDIFVCFLHVDVVRLELIVNIIIEFHQFKIVSQLINIKTFLEEQDLALLEKT
jgi:hypothetical protein